jgi:glycosyltransferase involved in cell wall biosynthesis
VTDEPDLTAAPIMTQPLTIALDARTLHAPTRRGTGKNLIDLYRHVLMRQPDWRVLAFHRGPAPCPLESIAGYEPHHVEMPGDRFDWWGRWRLPHASWSHRADLLHCPSNTGPSWNPVPLVLTIHDLLPLEGAPHVADRFIHSVEHAVRRRVTILTPSRFTAQQLMEHFHADPAQIVVNPWAPDSGMRRVDDPAELRAARDAFGVGERFVLHLGAPAPRKNTPAVIDAFASLPDSIRADWQLLIVGVDDESFAQSLRERVAERRAHSSIVLGGFVEETRLPALMSAASILAYPSISEGFGLPILDAAVTGLAVLTSPTTSLPEVAADAAEYVNPLEVDSIRAGLLKLIENASLRRELAERNARRTAAFTWDAVADRFIQAVHRSLHQAGRVDRVAA